VRVLAYSGLFRAYAILIFAYFTLIPAYRPLISPVFGSVSGALHHGLTARSKYENIIATLDRIVQPVT
jgi:hypothetical protein